MTLTIVNSFHLLHGLYNDFLLLLSLMYSCSFTSEKSAGECQTKIPRDHTLKKEVWAGFKQIEQVLILESKVV